MKTIIVFLIFLLLLATVTVIAPVPDKNPSQNSLSENMHKKVGVLLLGDIMLGRSVGTISQKRGTPDYPFLLVKEKLQKTDIVFANLESPITENCRNDNPELVFCAKPFMAEGLENANISVLSLANNHIGNYGKKGIGETKNILTEHGIRWVDNRNLEIIEKEGIKLGFVGLNFTDYKDHAGDFEYVRQSDPKVDFLIVGVHWGEEYASKPNTLQKKTAQKLIENGADIISGSHPHWVQTAEDVNGKKIYYSLGNFIFDQMWSEKTKKGMAVELTFENGKLIKEDKFHTYMINWAQPQWLTD